MEDKTYRFLFGFPRSKETRINHVIALTISLMTLCANIALFFIYPFEYNLYFAYGILISICLIGLILSLREMYLDWKQDDHNLISSLSLLSNFITTILAIMAYGFLDMIIRLPLS